MAILAIYPHASALYVGVAADDDTTKTTKFRLTSDVSQIIKQQVLPWLAQIDLAEPALSFIVTNGHLQKDAPSKLYIQSDQLLQEHAKSELSLVIATQIAEHYRIPVYIIDPSSLQECHPQALITGTPHLQRDCHGDTFIFKYLARQEVLKRNLLLSESQFIVANLDEEIHIGAICADQVVDSSTSANEGPFALGQSGSLPFDFILDLCEDLQDRNQALRVIGERGGLRGYLGLEKIADLFNNNHENSGLVQDALAYQVSKEIGAYATVLKGKVDAIIITGELARHEPLNSLLKKQIEFLGAVSVYPGNQGLNALLAGVQRIMHHEPNLNRNKGSDANGI